jgi:hypothetical protein
MTQIVINRCHGGFALSDQAVELYAQLAKRNLIKVPEKFFGSTWYEGTVQNDNYFSTSSINRDDPHLVQAVLQLGEAANSPYSKLKVVTIPDDVEWHIDEYDGWEWVAENHRTWN